MKKRAVVRRLPGRLPGRPSQAIGRGAQLLAIYGVQLQPLRGLGFQVEPDGAIPGIPRFRDEDIAAVRRDLGPCPRKTVLARRRGQRTAMPRRVPELKVPGRRIVERTARDEARHADRDAAVVQVVLRLHLLRRLRLQHRIARVLLRAMKGAREIRLRDQKIIDEQLPPDLDRHDCRREFQVRHRHRLIHRPHPRRRPRLRQPDAIIEQFPIVLLPRPPRNGLGSDRRRR